MTDRGKNPLKVVLIAVVSAIAIAGLPLFCWFYLGPDHSGRYVGAPSDLGDGARGAASDKFPRHLGRLRRSIDFPTPVNVNIAELPFYRWAKPIFAKFRSANAAPDDPAVMDSLASNPLIVRASILLEIQLDSAELPWIRTPPYGRPAADPATPAWVDSASLPNAWSIADEKPDPNHARYAYVPLATMDWLARHYDLAHPLPVVIRRANLPWRRDLHKPDPVILLRASLDNREELRETASLKASGFTPGQIFPIHPEPKENLPQASKWADEYLQQRHQATEAQAFRVSQEAKAQKEYQAQLAQQGKFPKYVMSMCRDLQGNLWVGAEADNLGGGEGVWRYEIRRHWWTHFTIRNGLGDDNAYAIACDRVGRVWVGHLNHGVSVYNGDKWQTYEIVAGLSRPGTLSGPIGERVFAIKICPTDGDVWISTSFGLARYSEKNQTWQYYTRAQGVPSDQIQALAFDKKGNIFCGTQCNGLAIGSADDDYASWRQITGPEQAPDTPYGKGLPSSLINDVLVARDGTVYVATTTGLAQSRDGGQTFRYLRGQDWADKVRGRYGGPPKGWSANRTAFLPEDYVTCLAESPDGIIWLGFRQCGAVAFDPSSRTILRSLAPHAFVTAVQADFATPAIGAYGDDCQIGWQNSSQRALPKNAEAKPIAFPAGAKPLTNENIDAMAAALVQEEGKGPQAPASPVISIDDDWRTEGAWIGRYGKYWAWLAAISGGDYLWGSGKEQIKYETFIGPNHSPRDSVRYWISWLYSKDSPSLEIPPVYLHSRVVKKLTTWDMNKRQAQWDDHGEVYLTAKDGPDLNGIKL